MAQNRRLNDHEMVAARWEYEHTAISERALAAKYGLGRTSLQRWISTQSWRKAEKLRDYAGEAGKQRLERDVKAAIKSAYDRKIIKSLEVAVDLPRGVNAATPEQCGHPAAQAAGDPASAPEKPPNKPKNAKPKTPGGAPPEVAQSGQVVRFPGAFVPPPTQKPNAATLLPIRSRTETQALRMRLFSLRGELAMKQVQAVLDHDEMLQDLQHLIAVYVHPAKFVDTSGLSDDDAVAKLNDVSKQAARILLPTERDTLAGIVTALNKSMATSISTMRQILGAPPAGSRGRGPGDDEVSEPPEPERLALNLDQLRLVQHSIKLLTQGVQAANEPPKPPAPDSLDDLVAKPHGD